MIYKCKLCNRIFNRKSNFDKHSRRKNPCINGLEDENETEIKNNKDLAKISQDLVKPIENLAIFSHNEQNIEDICVIVNDETNKKPFSCKVCNKSFSFQSSLSKHKKKHKNNDDQDYKINDLKDIIEKQQEKIDELEIMVKAKVKTRSKSINNNSHNTTNTMNNNNSHNTTNNTINNNIKIVNFGSEDIYSLPKDVIDKILFQYGSDPFNVSLENIHFNDNLPQYKNIKYTNNRSNVGEIYDNEKWISKLIPEIIDEIIDNHNYFLQEIKSNAGNKKLRRIYNEAIRITNQKDLSNNDLKELENIKTSIKLALYDLSKQEIKKQKMLKVKS